MTWSVSWDYTYFELALLYKVNRPFYYDIILVVLRFLWTNGSVDMFWELEELHNLPTPFSTRVY
jgi:hypothetical protein